MNKTRKVMILLTMLTSVILLVLGGCKKDDSTPAQKTSYDLKVKDVLGVSGTVTFIETSNTTATIDIVLVNAPSGTHPAFLLMYSEVEDGAVVVSLNPVDASGKSSTLVSTMTYSQLNAYDGFIKITKSNTEPGIILAQGDIGGNVITTTNKSYTLNTLGIYGVSGTALFEKRVNGNTLVTVTLEGTISGEEYPASINLGSVTSVGGGPVVKLLDNVDGTTGKSFTNIRKLDSGVAITYENWLVYDGYINIYQSPLTTDNIICNGNIGSN
jgi:hypothetical protein